MDMIGRQVINTCIGYYGDSIFGTLKVGFSALFSVAIITPPILKADMDPVMGA